MLLECIRIIHTAYVKDVVLIGQYIIINIPFRERECCRSKVITCCTCFGSPLFSFAFSYSSLDLGQILHFYPRIIIIGRAIVVFINGPYSIQRPIGLYVDSISHSIEQRLNTLLSSNRSHHWQFTIGPSEQHIATYPVAIVSQPVHSISHRLRPLCTRTRLGPRAPSHIGCTQRADIEGGQQPEGCCHSPQTILFTCSYHIPL